MRAQTCSQHHMFSICGETAAPIGPKIDRTTHWDNTMKIGGRRSRVLIDGRLRSTTYPAWAVKRLDRSSPKLVYTLIGTIGKSYGGQRSRVSIGVCAARANVSATLHIQHRRPNGWADRGPNWYTHSLEQWAEVMGVGDRGCALMCALCAQTCAQHYTSSIGGQTAGPIGAQIGTHTHWKNWQKIWGYAIAGAH
jgi:hypothetical protein